jgi:hypothetical protein
MHGPDPCENCGVLHTHVRLHMNQFGEPKGGPFTWAEPKMVRFYGFADDGTTLYVESENGFDDWAEEQEVIG